MLKCLKHFDINSNKQVQQVTSKTKLKMKRKKRKGGRGKSKQFVNDCKMKGNSNWQYMEVFTTGGPSQVVSTPPSKALHVHLLEPT